LPVVTLGGAYDGDRAVSSAWQWPATLSQVSLDYAKPFFQQHYVLYGSHSKAYFDREALLLLLL